MPTLHSQSQRVVVIGGGALGLTVAWRAAQRGLDTVVLERGEAGHGTSRVAAGMLAPVAEAAFGEDALLQLNLASARRWPAFAAELAEASGMNPGYLTSGTLLVARDRDQAKWLDREIAFREGHDLELRRLLPSEARQVEPALVPTLRGAAELPSDHTVDPRALVEALLAAALRAGAEIRERSPAQGLIAEGDRVTGVWLSRDETLSAEHVVVAAGAWSSGLEGVPERARVPVRPVKGQILRLRDPAGSGLLSRVLRTEDVYVVPRGDGRYVIGATVEERGWDDTVTAGGVYELLREASEVLPGVSEWEIEEMSAGLRPATPDNAPVIGPSTVEGLHWATGHYRHGVLQAPVTADIVAAALAGDAPHELERAFRPDRFAPAGTPA